MVSLDRYEKYFRIKFLFNFNFNFLFILYFEKWGRPSGCTLAQDFSQEKDFPRSKLLLFGDRTPEKPLSVFSISCDYPFK
jgi:hypothetical protein